MLSRVEVGLGVDCVGLALGIWGGGRGQWYTWTPGRGTASGQGGWEPGALSGLGAQPLPQSVAWRAGEGLALVPHIVWPQAGRVGGQAWRR